MAITFNDFSQNAALGGLGTYTVVIPNAGPYIVKGKLTLPTIVGGASANSSCVVTVVQNSTTIYTGNAGAEGFSTTFLGAAGDSIAITTSSAASVDQPLNAIKMVVGISQGVS